MTHKALFLLLITLLSACAKNVPDQTPDAENKKPILAIVPGELTQIDQNLWIQAEDVSYPELGGVILYSREDTGELRTVQAPKATIHELKEDVFQFTFHDASMVKGDSPENQEAILMNSYSFDVWKAPGWSYPSSSPFDKKGPVKSENKSFQYKVAKGDDIQSISRMFIVTEADILKWNPEIKSSDRLDVGQLIWIKGDDD